MKNVVFGKLKNPLCCVSCFCLFRIGGRKGVCVLCVGQSCKPQTRDVLVYRSIKRVEVEADLQHVKQKCIQIVI